LLQDVVKRMMVGSKTAVRTELTAQLEEQGYIEQVMSLLKEKNTPMPMKVAGVEVLKVCTQATHERTTHTSHGHVANGAAGWHVSVCLYRRCFRTRMKALPTLSRRS
jgi:hypothetical protein